jgi:hypothetical protein
MNTTTTRFGLYNDVIKETVNVKTGHENPEVGYRYSSTLCLTSTPNGVGGQCHAPTVYPGKTTYGLYRRLGRPHSRSGQVRKISSPTGILSQVRPTRSESLYRLSCRGSPSKRLYRKECLSTKNDSML